MPRFIYFLLFSVSFGLHKSLAQTEFRLGVEVRDKYTKKPLIPIVSVLAVNTESELTGQMVNDLYVVNVKAGTQYQVFVALQEYKTYRQTHTFEPNATPVKGIYPFIIELESIHPPKNFAVASGESVGHSILVIDKNQRAIVQRATVSLKESSTGQIIPVKNNPNVSGSWLAELKESEQYFIEVSAPDYETYKATLKVRAGEGLEILLNRIPKQELRFVAVDALTNKPIAAQFKLTDEIKESYTGSTRPDGSIFNPTVIVQKQPYLLIVTANGYRRHESKIAVTTEATTTQSPQIIRLSKVDVVLKINVFEQQSGQPLAANVRVIDQTDKRPVLNVQGVPKGQATLPLNPAHRYVIEAEAKGFMPYQQALEKVLPTLDENNDLTIKLTKIGDTYLHLTATSATTGRRMAAIFKITASLTGQTTVLRGTATAPLKHKINEPDIYQIETIAAGHLPLKYDLDAEEMTVGQIFNYEAQLTANSTKFATPILKPFFFQIIDNQNRRAIPNLRFSIVNQTTRRVIPVRLRGTEAQANLRIGETYLVEAQANGYEPITLRLETEEMAKRNQYLTNLSLNLLKKSIATSSNSAVNEKIFDNIKAGQSLSIEDNVYFGQSSYILRPEAHGQLNRLAAIMTQNPALKIAIVGHTDNVGDPRLNQILSEQRAKVIANYLINQGVSEANISHRGEGQTQPLAPNDTEENRQRNRRVQFLIM